METLLLISAIILGIFIVFFFLLTHHLKGLLSGKNLELKELKEKLEGNTRDVHEMLDRVTTRVTERLDKVTDQVSNRLNENVKAINESKTFLTQRVENTEKTVRSVTNRLATLQEISEKMMVTSQEILNFQQMLKIPKVRGGFGEILLETMLKDILPADRYQMQYKFTTTNEIADAIIRLMDNQIVVIDSKFPLSNFEKVVATEAEEKKAHFRAFINDIKKHVKDIASKYISPQEKTLDYAFMYIPMEGIYYEIIVRRVEIAEELWEYCMKHRVIPVSPNSFLSYLHTLLLGFRGMKIEQQAKEVLQYITQLRKDFNRFQEDFLTIGTHLGHAKNKFDDSSRRLERFQTRLESIDMQDAPLLPESNEPSGTREKRDEEIQATP